MTDNLFPANRKVITVPELAKVLGIGRSAAYAYVKAGNISAIRIGRSIRIPVSAVESLLESTL